MPSARGAPGAHVSARWAQWRAQVDLAEYDARWDRNAQAGHDVHGESDLVEALGARPREVRVLDAGCGMGRVAIELARRGHDVVGVDLDDDLLAFARRRAPHLRWVCADLATMRLGRSFDVIVMAGSVVNFCRPGDRAAIIANLADHLDGAGWLVSGSAVEPEPGGSTATAYSEACTAAGLELEHRWATWDRRPAAPDDTYAVFVHRRGSGPDGDAAPDRP